MKWTAEKRRMLAAGEIKGGFAGPDQSYPIADASDVKDAWGLAGQAENPDAVRRNIIRICKRLKLTDALPDSARSWAEEHDIALKAANMADWLEAQMHQQFTVIADNLFANGYVTREERIALSNGVGEALDAFHARLQEDDMAELRTRRPYEETGRQAVDDGEAKATLVVKSLGVDRIGGYAVLWGTPERKDLTGEYFTKDTADLTAIFDEIGALPSLYHHAMDSQLKTAIVGRVDVLKADDIGLWYEAQLATANKYRDAIKDLIGKGALGTSTGTLPGARKAAGDGKILRWPIAEISLTPTPAEPRMMERPIVEIKAAYAAIGLTFPVGDGASGAVEAQTQAVAVEVEAERLAWEALEL